MDIYFKSNKNGELNRLTILENSVKFRIDTIVSTLKQNNIDTADEIYRKLDALTELLNERVTAARANAAQVQSTFSEAEWQAFAALKKEQLSDDQVRSVAKKNNIERFVGLNVLNAIGIFLIIIGVIATARYAYVQLPDKNPQVKTYCFLLFHNPRAAFLVQPSI